MTRTLIGLDYEGVACVKITRDDLDPITTPDNTGGAFLFNSKDAVQLQICGVDITSDSDVGSKGTGPGGFGRHMYFGINNYRRNYFYNTSYFPGVTYDIPLTDFVVKSAIDGWYIKGKQDFYVYEGRQNSDVAYCRLHYPTANFSEAGWRKDYYVNVTGENGWQNGVSYYPKLLNFMNVISNEGMVAAIPYTFSDVFVWNLPATNQPLPAPLPNVPGLEAIKINNGLKIAKSGYDVNAATDAQLVLSSSKRATKIIAADDIAIPAGMSEYLLKVPVPAGSICDIQFYTGAEIYYPAPPYLSPVGADWRLQSDRIQFRNNGGPCRARFLVIINDIGIPQTSGDNNVFRQVTIDGENVVQFLRPGAGENPSFSDIIIDSRWPALRILKEGYFEVQPGGQVFTVPIETTGYFPFIKMMVNCAGRTFTAIGGVTIEQYSANIRPATVSMAKLSGNNWFTTGDSTYAKVFDDRVEFHTFRGNPKYYIWYYSDRTGFRLDTVYPDEVLGIRYYIFGIPKKDNQA